MRHWPVAILTVLLAACSPEPPAPGVPLDLAIDRSETISEVAYDLYLDIPRSMEASIEGRMTIRFNHAGGDRVVLDFVSGSITSAVLNGAEVNYSVVNEHVLVPGDALRATGNELTLDFTAGDASLNRNESYLYALFVPDRARQALPVFDQPNLKARWTLTLDVPTGWTALSNGAAGEAIPREDRSRHVFAQTEPIPTYLFTFVAGEFETVTRQVDGRPMTMYHRESDAGKLARNAPEIFELHGRALEWLEDYTGIPYPFGKFDFVLIPSFQFGGMEHPGAIHYRASSLMLDENAPQARLLGRASLIAHETAHMWFGDLVTMDWFNDVWTKEVFANFMAAKIVEPSFPEVNHELRFLMAHYPSAYGVDRTTGANPIRQDLENLNDAGSLYGAIIYQKAPIVMRNLEALVCREAFRDGIRTYLSRFAYANATWPELVEILDATSPDDITGWSQAWVEEAGRPDLTLTVVDGVVNIEEVDAWGRGLSWPQEHRFLFGGPAQDDASLVYGTRPAHAHAPAVTEGGVGSRLPDGTTFILPNHRGRGYGAYHVPANYLVGLAEAVRDLPDPVDRGAAWISLWEAVLLGELDLGLFLQEAQVAVVDEPVQLIRDRVSSNLRQAYWRFLSPEERLLRAAQVEAMYEEAMAAAPNARERYAHFKSWVDVVLTPSGVARLGAIWHGDTEPGVSLSEWDRAEIAAELAVRGVAQADSILQQQYRAIEDADRKARFGALMPALTADVQEREAWFESLTSLENRANESRVLEGVRYLNHPLRAREAEHLVRPALDLVLEIQETGDIFFPRRWLNAVLGGHQTDAVRQEVRAFLDGLPEDYPERLRGKVLQAADGLERASEISGQ
ncbi:MAG: hypothetical protein HKN29_11125 [Rhodothermales bacterium]|nr:hypothetical protein [Rhodothermales bacterium]